MKIGDAGEAFFVHQIPSAENTLDLSNKQNAILVDQNSTTITPEMLSSPIGSPSTSPITSPRQQAQSLDADNQPKSEPPSPLAQKTSPIPENISIALTASENLNDEDKNKKRWFWGWGKVPQKLKTLLNMSEDLVNDFNEDFDDVLNEEFEESPIHENDPENVEKTEYLTVEVKKKTDKGWKDNFADQNFKEMMKRLYNCDPSSPRFPDEEDDNENSKEIVKDIEIMKKQDENPPKSDEILQIVEKNDQILNKEEIIEKIPEIPLVPLDEQVQKNFEFIEHQKKEEEEAAKDEKILANSSNSLPFPEKHSPETNNLSPTNSGHSVFGRFFSSIRNKLGKENKEKDKNSILDAEIQKNEDKEKKTKKLKKGNSLNSLFIKSLKPTSEELKAMNLKYGMNEISFVVQSKIQGKQEIKANIYQWKHNSKIVISDIGSSSSFFKIFKLFLTFFSFFSDFFQFFPIFLIFSNFFPIFQIFSYFF